ncbi:hypothetical protein QE152_g1844 [Popillia japonica]|uniref:Uncharacterized protein n=1 Tax=Popillia japonica TaxID=7064 RepID=A0AAW1N3A8_POPJA
MLPSEVPQTLRIATRGVENRKFRALSEEYNCFRPNAASDWVKYRRAFALLTFHGCSTPPIELRVVNTRVEQLLGASRLHRGSKQAKRPP